MSAEMSHTDMQPLTSSPQTAGRYCIGQHELTSGDLIEFTDGFTVLPGRIEHDGMRYMVLTTGREGSARRLPLGELIEARYMGSSRL